MLYVSCPTCGYCLANKQITFEKEKEKICNNPDFSTEEKESKIKDSINKLGLRRYCCKMRFISYIDTVKIIM